MLAALTLSLVAQGPSTEALLPGEPDRLEAIAVAGRSADARYLPPLIDLLAFARTPEEWYATLDALGELLSEDLREVERPWRTLRLRLGTQVSGPADYLAFKRELLARRVDPRFRDLLADARNSRLPLERVDWGGVPVDGIPALVDPAVVPAAGAEWLRPEEPVFGLVVDGRARAYPLRILDWHEMVNDRLGDVAFALSYCTLCGAGVAYRTGDGDERDLFRSSGLLLDSNKLMYDEATESLWSQLEGRALHGARVGEDELGVLPVDLVPWSVWRARHPRTTVVDRETGFDRDYRLGAAYGDYFAASETMFPAPGVDEIGGRAKERVLVLRGAGRTTPVPVSEIAAAGALRVEGSGTSALVLAVPRPAPSLPAELAPLASDLAAWKEATSEELAAALHTDPALASHLTVELLLELPAAVRLALLDAELASTAWALSRDVRIGAAFRGLAADVRAYEAPDEELVWDGARLLDAQGRAWTPTTTALLDPNGGAYERLPSHLAFRFAFLR